MIPKRKSRVNHSTRDQMVMGQATLLPDRSGLFAVLAGLFEGRAENVTQRGTGISRTILGDGFFFFGHFQRLDRHRDLAGLAVEGVDAGVDFFLF